MTKRKDHSTSIHPLRQRRLAAIEAALTVRPMNVHDLSTEINLCAARTYDYLVELLAIGAIHIAAYRVRVAGNEYRIAVYRWGKGRNARKPVPLSNAEKGAAYLRRVLADDARRDLHRSKNRAHKALKRAKAAPRPWYDALPNAREAIHG